ncbi:hypothetical protein C8263_07295 [Deinococcus arcticus]|uniref:Uncharacterized protein n=1 Tax=Deinococcus arcticus TaxID=2136176 RepID=A0A2T3W9Q8_9DEIO|nr:hypothetical protein C8263_07295 [Deinococcus arcticus]
MLTFSLLSAASAQATKGKTELDRSSLTAGVDRLVGTVQEAVTASGGDLERQQAHWVFAFSTGHYKADPLGAQAAREVATQFVQRMAVTGDQVTARAWEMTTWEYRNPTALTLKLGNDLAADKARVTNLWPTTPAVGSAGGHDTEQAAVELTQVFANDAGTVLILLTNTAASVGAGGSKLLGTNAPAYQGLLDRWTRVDGTQDGATLNLPYVVTSPNGDVQGQMQAVVFVPKTFTSAQLTASTRSVQLQDKAAAKPSGQKGASVVPLLALLVLGGAGFAAWKLFASGGGGRGSVRIAETTFALRDLPKGKPFCVLAGPGYSGEDDIAVVPVQGFPSARIADISWDGKALKVRGVHDDVKLNSVSGRVVASDSATLPLRLDEPDMPLEFSGEVSGAGGVPRTINKTVNVSFSQGDA